jgi:hypothetical protein
MSEARADEREALEAFAKAFGRGWKDTLTQVYWYNARIWEGGEPGKHYGSTLHAIRNNRGPSWLYDEFKIEPEYRYVKSGSFVGKRIELGAHLDLWMRGARFGVVVMQSTKHKPGQLMRLKVRVDHPQVKRLAVLNVADIGRIL